MRTPTQKHAIVALGLVAVLVLALALVGCSSNTATPSTGGTSAPAASGTTITEKGFAFNPADVTVKVGDTVTFTNEDSTPHNVKIDGTELGPQNQGDSVTWKASKAGTFPYACVIHPSMTGQIIVQ